MRTVTKQQDVFGGDIPRPMIVYNLLLMSFFITIYIITRGEESPRL
jgi:hypothetical protein